MSPAGRWARLVFGVGIVGWIFLVPGYWVFLGTAAIPLAINALGLMVLVGWAGEVSLTHAGAHRDGGSLSGGEQQMLAIGRALMHRPRLLLVDEPSIGLAGGRWWPPAPARTPTCSSIDGPLFDGAEQAPEANDPRVHHGAA